ncbi:unnamed protein product [Calicophoron daubneyi]|uniref:Exocyst complex component Sec6 n=2 Tax=Calicophoron daubneyi TaxID=300641 RepID=A0AAV2TKK6_CALDB
MWTANMDEYSFPNGEFSLWNSSVGKVAIESYATTLFNDFLGMEVIPKVILETLKGLYEDIFAGKVDNVKPAYEKVDTWKLNQHAMIKQLDHILNSDESHSQTLRKTKVENTLSVSDIDQTRKPVWQVQAASRAIVGAIAYDIYDSVLDELLRYHVPKTVRLVVWEVRIFDLLLKEIVQQLMVEVAKEQLLRTEEKERKKRFSIITQMVQENPGDMFAALSLELLLPYAGGQIPGSFAKDRVQEYFLHSLCFDLLLDWIKQIDASADGTVNCIPVGIYHALVNKDAFFEEALQLLLQNVEEDSKDTDLAEVMSVAQKRCLGSGEVAHIIQSRR